MDKQKIIKIISSVFIAFALWVYVISVVDPVSSTVVRNIPVRLTGMEQLYSRGLAINSDCEYYVDLSISATRTDLITIPFDNFIATADVSNLTMGQDFIVVSVKSPTGYSVDDIRSRKIEVLVDELGVKEVPVEINYKNAIEGQESAVLNLNPEFVEIKGAKEIVDRVAKYSIELDASALSYETPSDLVLSGTVCDEQGSKVKGVSCSINSALVSAANYSTKVVNFDVKYVGKVWEGAVMSSLIAPSTIVIKGETKLLSSISSIESKEISIEDIFEDAKLRLEPILPKGVYVANESKDAALEIDIAEEGYLNFEFDASEIKTNNLPTNMSVNYTPSVGSKIVANVTGPVSKLKTMSKNDISLTVDAENFVVGNKSVKIELACQISGIKIELSPSDVIANIRWR